MRLGVLLGKPRLLPALQTLQLGGRNRFGDAGLAAFAALGLNPATAATAAAGVGAGAGAGPSSPRTRAEAIPPAMWLHTLDLGVNGLTASGQGELGVFTCLFERRGWVSRLSLLIAATAHHHHHHHQHHHPSAGGPRRGFRGALRPPPAPGPR